MKGLSRGNAEDKQFIQNTANNYVVESFVDVSSVAPNSGLPAATNEQQYLVSSGSGSELAGWGSIDNLVDNAIIKYNAIDLAWQVVFTPAASEAGATVYDKEGAVLYSFSGSSWIISSGSGGGLDVFLAEKFVASSASSFTKGNNLDFGVAGVFAGSLDSETVNPISGSVSIKYTQAAGSLNDWFMGDSVSIDPKQAGNTSGLSLYFKYDGLASDIEVVVYDVTNSKVLTSSTDLLTAASNSTRYVTSFTPPVGCTSVKYGFQVKVVNSGKILIFDDVEMSTDPFVYKQLVTQMSGSISETLTATYLDNDQHKIEFTGSAGNSNINRDLWNPSTLRYEIKIAGHYVFSCKTNWTNPGSSTRNFGITIKVNGATLDNSLNGSYTANTNTFNLVTNSEYFEAGDYVEAFAYHNDTVGTASATLASAEFLISSTETTEHVVTPTSMVKPVRYTSDTERIIPDNVTTILDYNNQNYDDDSLYSQGVTYVAGVWTTDPKYTAPKDGYYRVGASLMFENTTDWAEHEVVDLTLYKNGALYSSLDAQAGHDFSASTKNVRAGGSDTIYLLKDDYIDVRVRQLSGVSLALVPFTNQNYLTIEAIAPQSLLSAIPTNYANVNPNILINGDMRVNQRGTLPFPASVNGIYYIDRWKVVRSVVVQDLSLITTAQPSALSGSSSLKSLVPAAGGGTGYIGKENFVEDFALYKGKTVTFSAYVKSNSTNARLRITDGISDYQSTAHTGEGAWERLSVTATLPSSIVHLHNQILIYDNGSVVIADNDFIEFTGAKLELGSHATEFVADSFGDSLRKCERYYQKSYVYGTPAGTFTNFGAYDFAQTLSSLGNSFPYSMYVRFDIPMFETPDINVYSRQGGINKVSTDHDGTIELAAGSAGVNHQTNKSFKISNNSGASVTIVAGKIIFHWEAEAEL